MGTPPVQHMGGPLSLLIKQCSVILGGGHRVKSAPYPGDPKKAVLNMACYKISS